MQPTTAAIITAPVPAAIASIAVIGPAALAHVCQHLRGTSGRALALQAGLARYALWHFTSQALPAEHVVVLARDATHIEVHCHGGLAITKAILHDLEHSGCQTGSAVSLVDTVEESFEASVERAARMALMHAPTLKVAAILLDQMQGVLSQAAQRMQHAWRMGDDKTASELRQQLLRHGQFGLKLIEPWRLTLAGPPNVGKSSLLNALYGSDRVLVHEQPGTTRDAVDTPIVIADWPMVVTDTAGIRLTEDAIERQGVATAGERWMAADIGLLVVDATSGWTTQHDHLLSQRTNTTCMIVMNKCDCLAAIDIEKACRKLGEQTHRTVIAASAIHKDGLDDLLLSIGHWLDSQQPPPGAGVPFTRDQIQLIENMIG